MTPLERKIAKTFLQNGNHLLASLPDWRNSEILIAEHNAIDGQWIDDPSGRAGAPKIFRHRFSLSAEKLLAAHLALSQETLAGTIVVEASVVADRASDGAVYEVTGFRRESDIAVQRQFLAMRTHDGNWLINPTDEYRYKRIAEIRKSWRLYQALTPEGTEWDSELVIRDPHPENFSLEGTLFSHIVEVRPDESLLLAFVRPPSGTMVRACRANDGRWVVASEMRIWSVLRDYEMGTINPIRDEDGSDTRMTDDDKLALSELL